MPFKDTATFSTLNGLHGPGRPSKRTKKIVCELTDAIASGAPYGLACQAAGIHYDTFCDWRRRDPTFAAEVEQAAARGTISRLKEIEAQGRGGAWQALSWMIERRYPADFAKPEVALNIGIQHNLNAGGANGHSFESIIVSDLEFLKLREHENYEHRKHEQPAREVDAQAVPVDLSGTLTMSGHPGSAVISESQSDEIGRRAEQANARVAALFAARREAGENGQNGSNPSEEADHTSGSLTMTLAPIVMPEGEPGQWWWAQFCRSASERLVEQRAAQWVCEILGRETLGAGNARVEFENDTTVGELLSALERLTGGPHGWQALLCKAELACRLSCEAPLAERPGAL